MLPENKTARIAGALYLIVVLTGIFNLMYVPSKLMVDKDATATFHNILYSQNLFRLGILSAVVCYIAFLLLPLALYKLLKPVNQQYAILMIAFALVSVPLSFINLQHKFAIIELIDKAELLSYEIPKDMASEAMNRLNAYRTGNQIISLFWGLWLFPFGMLVYRSGFLPKLLGIFLMAGCVGYLINFTGKLMIPYYSESGISSYISLPASIGEIGICLWLLIVGVKKQHS